MAEDNTDNTSKKETKERRWWPAFFDALGRTGNVLLSCKAAHIGRRAVYTQRNKSDRFRKLWDEALEDATDMLEAEARRRGMHGTERGVYYKGRKIDTVKETSDTLLIFLLKAHRPEKFRDNYDLKRLIEEYTTQRTGDGEPAPGDAKGD